VLKLMNVWCEYSMITIEEKEKVGI